MAGRIVIYLFFHGGTFCSGEQQAAQKHSSLYPTSSALIGRVADEHGAAFSKPSVGHFFGEFIEEPNTFKEVNIRSTAQK